MPQVDGVFDGRPARFNIDTGSRSDVTLTRPFVERVDLRRSYPGGITATEGWGVGGATRPYLVRAASVTLGSVAVPRPIAGLSESKRGAFSDANYDGNVGSGILKRYVVTFDYAHHVMYLKPAEHIDADTGQFDRTGLWLNLADGGVEIKDVTSGSPAAEAGLRAGDIVIAIDGTPVKTDSLSNLRRRLKLVPVGQPLNIAYRRANATRSATLVPRKLIPD
jgi:membrane-associated protease RseP (regulator of RpoE activity)